MSYAVEEANRKRDRRLRRFLLVVLQAARVHVTGRLGGISLADNVNAMSADDQRLSDDDHCIALARDLVAKGLIEEHRKERRRGEAFGLRHVEYSITAKGSSLLNETMPADPDVDDDRITE